MADVMKVLEDLKYKAVGVDPTTKEMPKGYFVSFRPIGLPVHKIDYGNPWTPTGSNLKDILDSKPKDNAERPPAEGRDPAEIEAKSMSKQLEDMEFKTAGISSSQQAFLNTFMLTDEKLVLGDTYRVANGSSKLNDTWYAIINGAHGIAPDMEMNDDIKKAIEKAKAVSQTPEGDSTLKFEKYMQYREEYQDAVQNRNRQYANALTDPMKLQMWPIHGKTYQDDVEFAWSNWQSRGFKQEIDEAAAVLSSQGIDPAILLIARSKQKYENSLVNIPNIGNIPYTFMSPSKWYSPNATGWNSYSQRDFHTESHFDSETKKTAAGGGFNIGIYRAGGHGASSDEKTSLNIETEGMQISFDYSVADIRRAWLDSTLLNLDNWFLAGDYPKSCISNGTFEQEFKTNDPNEMLFMPSVVTSLILARNVSIKWRRTASDMEKTKNVIAGGGSVGIGPFRFGASHSKTHEKKDSSFDDNSQGLSIEGVQIIGYISAIMPGSPKKNGKDYMQKKKDQPAKPASSSEPIPAPAPVAGPAAPAQPSSPTSPAQPVSPIASEEPTQPTPRPTL